MSGPVADRAHSKWPPSAGTQYRVVPSVSCMPAPKITLPSNTAGELTTGNRTNGGPLVQVGLTSFTSFGLAGMLLTTPALNAPSAGNNRSPPLTTGEATN